MSGNILYLKRCVCENLARPAAQASPQLKQLFTAFATPSGGRPERPLLRRESSLIAGLGHEGSILQSVSFKHRIGRLRAAVSGCGPSRQGTLLRGAQSRALSAASRGHGFIQKTIGRSNPSQ